MSDTRPGVIVKSKFRVCNGAKKIRFKDFLNYIDRSDTHKEVNEMESYQDYMADEEKSTGLFTNYQDHLTHEEKDSMKEVFKQSQEKGSILWQDIISFDNYWLKELGVLNGDKINEGQLKKATRQAVNEMLKREKLLETSTWTAAIHYNTDNIHIHVATVQTSKFRQRGKRKQKSLDSMKSKMTSLLMNRSHQNELLNTFIRDRAVGGLKNDNIMSLKNKLLNRDLTKQFEKVYDMLPSDKRLWKYDMNALNEVRPEINRFTEMYIEKHLQVEHRTFMKQLDKEVEVYKRAYGSNANAEQFKQKKMQDLYTRMGNTLLKEMKTYDQQHQIFSTNHGRNMNRIEINRSINEVVYVIDRRMKNNLQHFKNQRAFEQLQREQEHGR